MLGGHSAGISVKVNCGGAWVVVIPVLRSGGFDGSSVWVMVCGAMVWVMVCGSMVVRVVVGVPVTSSQPPSSSVFVGFMSVDFEPSVGVEVMVISTQVVTGVVIQTFVTEGSPSQLSLLRRRIFAGS
jgi:hypothetical protein